MCLILFRFDPDLPQPLVVAANRDESYRRPSSPAAFWQDQPHIYGGRDLEANGSWLAVDKRGRFAALTNFRDGQTQAHSGPSRGELVAGFLSGEQDGLSYLRQIQTSAQQYQGFNLLVGDSRQLWHYSNREPSLQINSLTPGYYSLSNHLLNTPWPKSEQGKQKLQQALEQPQQNWPQELQDLLLNDRIYPDEQLPETGIDLEIERLLSPIYIRSEHYGTRSSSIVIIDSSLKQLNFHELNYPYGNIDQKSHSHQQIALGT